MKIEKRWTKKSKKTKNSFKELATPKKQGESTIPLKIYVDESVNIAIVEGLQRRGINAFSTKDLGKLGLTDEEQLKTAIQTQAIIFTNNADFIKIALNKNHSGIIYVHQQKLTIGERIKRLKLIAETKTLQEMANQIIFL